MKITKKSQITLLVILAFAVYFTSYLTRVGYNTMLVEIGNAEGYADTRLSFAVTASFISYGVGMLISGYLGDRFDPLKLISAGLLVTTVINFAMPFAPSPEFMAVLWGVNGFCQAFIYPPTVKALASYLPAENYAGAIMIVACAGNLGTLAITLSAPLIIHLSGWRTAFICYASFAAVVLIVWTLYSVYVNKRYGGIEKPAGTNANSGAMGFIRPALACGIVFVMLSIFVQGFVKDGATTWMPTYVSENFGLSSEQSILSTLMFPIIGTAAVLLTTFLKNKVIRNEIGLAAMYLGICALCVLGLLVLPKNYILSTVLLTLVITASMSANYVTINFIPIRFSRYGKVSLMAGMLNACTFLGSSLSAYSTALIKDGLGWSTVLLVWLALSVVGMLIALIPAKKLSHMGDK